VKFVVVAGLNRSDRGDHLRRVVLNLWPARGWQYDHGNSTSGELLLMAQILVCGDQHVEDAASAASSNSPLPSVDHPRSYAVPTVCPTNASRSGTGVPWSKRMVISRHVERHRRQAVVKLCSA
jgi:hypothetical protein